MVDAIDKAFLARWQTATAAATATASASASAAAGGRPRGGSLEPDPPAGAPAALVDRLLAAASDEWHALAARVEDARMAGRRVIAIAGNRPGEGRTTLMACLAAALVSRGADVVCVESLDALTSDAPTSDTLTSSGEHPWAGGGHDRRIILLDAGVWFPPGPLRRQRIMTASLGVDAAILVRRADAPGGTARRAALESLGIDVLGEVLTFTSLDGCEAAAESTDTGAPRR